MAMSSSVTGILGWGDHRIVRQRVRKIVAQVVMPDRPQLLHDGLALDAKGGDLIQRELFDEREHDGKTAASAVRRARWSRSTSQPSLTPSALPPAIVHSWHSIHLEHTLE